MLFVDERCRAGRLGGRCYDLFVSALGYERRCTYISNSLISNINRGICFKFNDRNILSFVDNLDAYERLGFSIVDWTGHIDHEQLGALLISAVSERSDDSEVVVGIDISSMTRSMTAEIIHWIVNQRLINNAVLVDLLYAPTVYRKPIDMPLPVTVAGPVIPEYAGWSLYPDNPSIAIIGLGYEHGRALGALEYLDVSDTWLFKPVGEDPKFETSIDRVNRDLINMVGSHRVISYTLDDPYDTFVKLLSLVHGARQNSRLIFMPFGPKVFNILALVIAELVRPDVSVWRVSGEQQEAPVDLDPSGKIVSFCFRLSDN